MADVIGSYRIADHDLKQLDYTECDNQPMYPGKIEIKLLLHEVTRIDNMVHFTRTFDHPVQSYYVRYARLLNPDDEELWSLLSFLFFWGDEEIGPLQGFDPIFEELSDLVSSLRSDDQARSVNVARGSPPIILDVTLCMSYHTMDHMDIALNHSGSRVMSLQLDPLADRDEPNHTVAPATDLAIKELEKVRVVDNDKGSVEDDSCSICMEKFKVGLIVTRMPCSHIFHGRCIVKWLKRNHLCPLCRYALPSL